MMNMLKSATRISHRKFLVRCVALIAFIAMGLHFSPHANAQRPDMAFGQSKQMPDFQIDWAQFQSQSPGETRLEVYYRIPNSGVSFRVVDSGYEASYELRIAIFDGKRRIKSTDIKKRIFVKSYERTTRFSDFVLNEVFFNLPPKKYEIRATLVDRYGDNSNTLKAEAKLSRLHNTKYPRLSGIEFLRSFEPAGDSAQFFLKGDAVAVPSVRRSMQGSKEGGPLLFYFELYSGRDTEINVLIDTRIKSRKGGLIYRDTLYVRMDQPITRQMRSVSLDDFEPGSYSLTIDVYTPRKKKPISSRSERFEIKWSLLAMVKYDYKSLVSQLEHITTPEEYQALKRAKTVTDRVQAWENFWNGRDPSPDSRENEARTSFYARVRYANDNFSSPRRVGWRSDRGMILLGYGPPDEAVDEPMAAGSRAYQIWYYYNYDGVSLRFLFLDEFGDGDFQLQYPFDGRSRY